jgi:hypothetical protein
MGTAEEDSDIPSASTSGMTHLQSHVSYDQALGAVTWLRYSQATIAE